MILKPIHPLLRLIPVVLLICTTTARADSVFVQLSETTHDTMANLGMKFVIGCVFLAAGMVGSAFVSRKK